MARDVLGITASTLEFVLEAAAQSHPNEYMGLLRGEAADAVGIDRDGIVLTEVLVIPGTESNPVSATVKTSMVPNDRRAMGSVHSHPNGVLRPSAADRAAFGRGRIHIILGAPYGLDDWRAFDRGGEPFDGTFEVFEIDEPAAPDEEFFDFTQADIDAELAAERDRDERGRDRDPERR